MGTELPGSAISRQQHSRTAFVDRRNGMFLRIEAAETLMDLAMRRGEEEVDALLDRMAAFATDRSDDFDVRMSAAQLLIDSPRERHRTFLEEICRNEDTSDHFTARDIEYSFGQVGHVAPVRDVEDPLLFYTEEAIQERQRRRNLADDDAEFALPDFDDFDDDTIADSIPFVRDTPKVGRNDPCPCGSGKKYKKCCLDRDA